jgi:hypothetical protein
VTSTRFSVWGVAALAAAAGGDGVWACATPLRKMAMIQGRATREGIGGKGMGRHSVAGM